jgi:hypothetical protein
MKRWGIFAGFLAVIVVLALVGGLFLSRPWGLGYIGCPAWGSRTGGYMMGPGMMWGFSGGFGLLGWTFALIGMLIPLALLALLVIGVVWGVQSLTRQPVFASSTPPSASTSGRHCPECDRPMQDDWRVCPYCFTHNLQR